MMKIVALALFIFLIQATNTSARFKRHDSNCDIGVQPSVKRSINCRHMNFGVKANDESQQSPIDITDDIVDVVDDYNLVMNSAPASAVMSYTGNFLLISWTGGNGELTFDHKTYFPRYCYWTYPASHIINGARYELELHIVHTTYDNKETAIAALQYYPGVTSDSFISELEESLEELANNPSSSTINVGLLGHPVVSRTSPFYSYMGSLVFPPYTEGVTWIIDTEVRSASRQQLNLIERVMGNDFNSRPTQPINSRRVVLHKPQSANIRQVTEE